MILAQVIKKLKELHTKALNREDVLKPISWALYETWKWADAREKARPRESMPGQMEWKDLIRDGKKRNT